ncbi:MAG TPA: hypothetical protein VHZ24_03855 [Pirellulales bacterium]|jgi:hypothetical protein|nr:hypothetical protein [Pirellulales bacterium]
MIEKSFSVSLDRSKLPIHFGIRKRAAPHRRRRWDYFLDGKQTMAIFGQKWVAVVICGEIECC